MLSTQSDNKFSMLPTNWQEAVQLSEMIANSDFVPSLYRGKPGNVLVCMQMGFTFGLAPMQAINEITVINGKPAMSSRLMKAIVLGSDECADIIEEGDHLKARCTVHRKGKKPSSYTFTIEEAKTAGLLGKDNWKNYPKRMLLNRARSFALLDAFPDILMGIEPQEVMEEIEVKQNLTTDNLKEKLMQPTQSILKDKPLDADLKPCAPTDLDPNQRIDLLVSIKDLILELQISDDVIQALLTKVNVTSVDELPLDRLESLYNWLQTKLHGEQNV